MALSIVKVAYPWVRPLEAVLNIDIFNEDKREYREFLEKEEGHWKLKNKERTEIKSWFTYYQLHDRFYKDKKIFFWIGNLNLKKCWKYV